METIFEDNKKRQIVGREEITVTIKTVGLYLLEVSARAKGEKQVGGTNDEDLRIEVDGIRFPYLTNPKRYADSPAAFSGGSLHDKKKSIYFFLELKSGKHEVALISDISATFEEINVSKFDFGLTEGLNLDLKVQAEDGDRRPWITFVFMDLALASFFVKATLKRRFIDSDDIKVIVDGVVHRNYRSFFHKYWYFIGSLFTGEAQSSLFNVNLPMGLHYIELWADRMPTLDSTKFVFGMGQQRIQPYKDSKFGRDYNQLDKFILDAVSFWNNFFSQQDYPPPVPLDPSLVKAMIYRESKLGYYPDSKIIDVMQVWNDGDPAKDALLGKSVANEFITTEKTGHISYSYPKNRIPPEVETREESIFWGVRWLYYKAQSLDETGGKLTIPYIRRWFSWREAVWNYNANPKIVEEYVKEVFSIYEKGVDLKGNVLWES